VRLFGKERSPLPVDVGTMLDRDDHDLRPLLVDAVDDSKVAAARAVPSQSNQRRMARGSAAQ
jgi:hypothetical protein